MLSDSDLMMHHVKVLFQHDDNNRMTVVNEPPYDAAPQIFIGGTRLGKVIRYSSALHTKLVMELEHLIRQDSELHLGKIIGILSADKPINHFWTGPALSFPNIINKSIGAVRITESNKEVLHTHFPDFLDDLEIVQPCFAVIQNGTAVSLCCSARQTSTCAEASLQTAESFRGKGYALDVSNAWAAEVQSQGRIALYSTSWDNFASQSVARKLNLVQYGTDIHMS